MPLLTRQTIRSLLALVLFACVLLQSVPVESRELSVHDGLQEPVAFTGELSMLRDPSGTMTLEQVRGADASRFQTLHDDLNVGATSDTVWLRFAVSRQSTAPSDWLLQVQPVLLDEVRIFQPDGVSAYRETVMGEAYSFAERPLPFHRDMTIRMHLPDERVQTWYLAIRHSGDLRAVLRVWQHEGLARASTFASFAYGSFAGAMGIIVLVLLIVFAWLQRLMYLTHAVYMVTMLLAGLSASGFMGMWIFPEHPRVVQRAFEVLVFLHLAAMTQFMLTILQPGLYWRGARRGFQALLWLNLIGALLACLGRFEIVGPLLHICFFAELLLFFSILPGMLHQRSISVRLYAFAFTLYELSLLLVSIGVEGWVPQHALVSNAALVGIVAHFLLLVMALVMRVRATMVRALEAVENNERDLERRVAARTEDLRRANAALAAEVRERKFLGEQLQHTLGDLQLMLQRQREFVAMVSHEFRTPLTIIDTTAQTLGLSPDLKGASSERRLNKIRRSVAALSALIDNCLNEERLEQTHFVLNDQHLNLPEVIRDVCAQRYAPAQLQWQLESAQSVPIEADRAMLEIALSNLLDNAVKYSRAPAQVRIEVNDGGEWVTVTFIDQGAGIPPEQMPLLFEKFQRGRELGNVSGAGLGLYLVRRIAEAHGGTVEVFSRLGEGATFTLRLRRRTHDGVPV